MAWVFDAGASLGICSIAFFTGIWWSRFLCAITTHGPFTRKDLECKILPRNGPWRLYRNELISGLHVLGGGLDEPCHLVRVGDHRHVARLDLDRGRAHAAGELALGVRRDRLVASPPCTRSATISRPGRPSRPGRQTAASGCCTAYMTRALTGSTSAAKCLTKSSSGSQAKPCSSMSRCARAGVGGPCRQQRADRFALVKPEGGDVDQADDVRRVGAERGHDLPAVGMAGDDRRAVLAVQHLAEPGDVRRQRGLGELRGGDVVAVGLKALDDGAPARAVGPCAVHQNDIRLNSHVSGPLTGGALPPVTRLSTP